jgi:nucleotide-binding universal stress UspA family protein
MKKVLIALDYDPTARKIAEAGFALAKAMVAEVVLVNVIADVMYYSANGYSPVMGFSGYMNTAPAGPGAVEEVKKSSQLFLDKSKKHLGDESIQTLVTEGDFASSILKAANDLHADIYCNGFAQQKMA